MPFFSHPNGEYFCTYGLLWLLYTYGKLYVICSVCELVVVLLPIFDGLFCSKYEFVLSSIYFFFRCRAETQMCWIQRKHVQFRARWRHKLHRRLAKNRIKWRFSLSTTTTLLLCNKDCGENRTIATLNHIVWALFLAYQFPMRVLSLPLQNHFFRCCGAILCGFVFLVLIIFMSTQAHSLTANAVCVAQRIMEMLIFVWIEIHKFWSNTVELRKM